VIPAQQGFMPILQATANALSVHQDTLPINLLDLSTVSRLVFWRGLWFLIRNIIDKTVLREGCIYLSLSVFYFQS
jgi:hypothetical protein